MASNGGVLTTVIIRLQGSPSCGCGAGGSLRVLGRGSRRRQGGGVKKTVLAGITSRGSTKTSVSQSSAVVSNTRGGILLGLISSRTRRRLCRWGRGRNGKAQRGKRLAKKFVESVRLLMPGRPSGHCSAGFNQARAEAHGLGWSEQMSLRRWALPGGRHVTTGTLHPAAPLRTAPRHCPRKGPAPCRAAARP